jgi:hypothetical protein
MVLSAFLLFLLNMLLLAILRLLAFLLLTAFLLLLSDYRTRAIGLSFFLLSNFRDIEYRIGEFKKLSDYRILDQGLNLSDYQISDYRLPTSGGRGPSTLPSVQFSLLKKTNRQYML